MSCNWASAAIPMSSASLARGLSSDLRSSVSAASKFFSLKPFPSAMRNGSENWRALLMISFSFICCPYGISYFRSANHHPELYRVVLLSPVRLVVPAPNSILHRIDSGQHQALRANLKHRRCSAGRLNERDLGVFAPAVRVACAPLLPCGEQSAHLRLHETHSALSFHNQSE